MAGLLGEIYSAGDTVKRRLRGLLDDPAGTMALGVTRFGEDQRGLLNLMSNAYPMAGEKTVLNNPEQIAQFRGQLADNGTEQAMAGMFVGPGSKTWDALGAAKAQQLMDAGTDARKIWSETGTWKGPDGKWRQEIPDNKAFYDHEALSDLKLNNPSFDYLKHTQPLGGVLEHKDLYRAYPDAGDIKTHFMPVDRMRGADAAYSFKTDRLTLPDLPNKDQTSNALHELQHAIQQREGFARGGSPEMFANTMPYESLVKRSNSQQDAFIRAKAAGGVDPESGLSLGGLKQSIDDLSGQIQSWKSPHDQYMHLAGEAEARATQARIPLDAAQRRALFPEDSYDVPINQLIMRGLLDK